IPRTSRRRARRPSTPLPLRSLNLLRRLGMKKGPCFRDTAPLSKRGSSSIHRHKVEINTSGEVSMRCVYSHLFNHAVLQFLPNFGLQPMKLAYVVFVYVVRDHDHEVPAKRPAYALCDQKGTCFDPRSGGID